MAKTWVDRKLDMALGTRKFMLRGVALAILFFAVLAGATLFEARIAGLGRLDSKEKLERFSRREYAFAELIYNQAAGLRGSFDVLSESQYTIGTFSGGYIEAPLGSSTSTATYHVWALKGRGYQVLLCSKTPFEDMGSVFVASKYRHLNKDVLADFAPGSESTYVLYAASRSWAPRLAIMAALFFAAAFLWYLSASPFLRRRTWLGKQIAAMGDFRAVSAELNRQAAHPLYECSSITVLPEYTLIGQTALAPTAGLQDIILRPDEEDAGQLEVTFLFSLGQQYTFYVDASQEAMLNQLKADLLPARENGQETPGNSL